MACASCGYAPENGHEPHCLWGHTVKPPAPAVAEVRATSVQALVEVEAEGGLAGQAAAVLAYLESRGPASGREIDRALAVKGDASASFHKRLPELRDAGLVEEDGEGPCSITGRTTILWRAVPGAVRRAATPRVSRLEALAQAFEREPGRVWTGLEVAAALRARAVAAAGDASERAA
jgi:hypothetical protein